MTVERPNLLLPLCKCFTNQNWKDYSGISKNLATRERNNSHWIKFEDYLSSFLHCGELYREAINIIRPRQHESQNQKEEMDTQLKKMHTLLVQIAGTSFI